MTVPTEQSRVEYVGNGATTVFAVPYFFFDPADLVVKKILTSSGLQTTLVLGVDYTLSGGGGAAGAVTMLAAPSNLYTLRIDRAVPITQPTAFRTEGAFSPATHEDAFDRVVEVCQELRRDVDDLQAAGAPVGTLLAGKGLAFAGTTLNFRDGTGLVVPAGGTVNLDYDSADPGDMINVAPSAADLGSSPFPARVDHKHNATVAAPISLVLGAPNAIGAAAAFAASNHSHGIPAPGAPVNVTRAAAVAGTSGVFADQDHKHDIGVGAPSSIGTANAAGVSVNLAPADHVHDHGALLGGDRHALAVAGASHGFFDKADKTKLDAIGLSHMRATRATAQTLANGVPSTILFTAVAYDLLTEYAVGTGKFTANAAGYYRISAYIQLVLAAVVAGNNFQIYITLNGAPGPVGDINEVEVAMNRQLCSRLDTVLHLAAGDTVEITAMQVGPATINTVASALTNYFTVDRLP